MLTISASYSACEFANLGKGSATITMNGCDYVFHANGETDIECGGLGPITIDVSVATVKKCTITIPQQTGIRSVSYTNNVGGSVSVSQLFGGIVYETHSGTGAGACPATTTPTVGGSGHGFFRLSGTNGGVAERIWVE